MKWAETHHPAANPPPEATGRRNPPRRRRHCHAAPGALLAGCRPCSTSWRTGPRCRLCRAQWARPSRRRQTSHRCTHPPRRHRPARRGALRVSSIARCPSRLRPRLAQRIGGALLLPRTLSRTHPVRCLLDGEARLPAHTAMQHARAHTAVSQCVQHRRPCPCDRGLFARHRPRALPRAVKAPCTARCGVPVNPTRVHRRVGEVTRRGALRNSASRRTPLAGPATRRRRFASPPQPAPRILRARRPSSACGHACGTLSQPTCATLLATRATPLFLPPALAPPPPLARLHPAAWAARGSGIGSPRNPDFQEYQIPRVFRASPHAQVLAPRSRTRSLLVRLLCLACGGSRHADPPSTRPCPPPSAPVPLSSPPLVSLLPPPSSPLFSPRILILIFFVSKFEQLHLKLRWRMLE